MSTFSKLAERECDTPSHTRNWACLRAIVSLLTGSETQSRIPAHIWHVATVSTVSITVSCRIRVASGLSRLACGVTARQKRNHGNSFSGKHDLTRPKTLRLSELVRLLVRHNHIAGS